jgi:hypothetical protein
MPEGSDERRDSYALEPSLISDPEEKAKAEVRNEGEASCKTRRLLLRGRWGLILWARLRMGGPGSWYFRSVRTCVSLLWKNDDRWLGSRGRNYAAEGLGKLKNVGVDLVRKRIDLSLEPITLVPEQRDRAEHDSYGKSGASHHYRSGGFRPIKCAFDFS